MEYRQAWGEERVYFYGEEGELERMPARWTDAVGVDPVIVVGGGRCWFRVEDLFQLVRLLAGLGR